MGADCGLWVRLLDEVVEVPCSLPDFTCRPPVLSGALGLLTVPVLLCVFRCVVSLDELTLSS